MRQYLKRSAAWLLCLAMVLSLFAGVPGAVISKVSAEETEGTETTQGSYTADILFQEDFDDVASTDELVEEGWSWYQEGQDRYSIVEDAKGGNMLKFTQNYDNATVTVVAGPPRLHETGNPILIVLLSVLAIVGVNIRRKF